MGRYAALLVAAVLLAGCGGTREEPATSVPPPAAVNTKDTAVQTSSAAAAHGSVLRYRMRRLDGRRVDLAQYKGKVVLVVNTATECGFTPQLKGLQTLYDNHRGDGLVLLGFPSNDFSQEPRSDTAIAHFCKANYGVTFPMFGKTTVVGDNATPLFKDLGAPSWNFNKYLLDRQGRLVKHWDSSTTPEDPALLSSVDRLLRQT